MSLTDIMFANKAAPVKGTMGILVTSLLSLMFLYGCIGEKEKLMNNEQDNIISETKAFAESWNKGDARGAAFFFTEDGLRVGAFGDVQKGRNEIEAAYERLMHQTMPGARIEQEEGTVRMLTPDLALWQAGIEIIPSGDAAPVKGHVIQLMKKVDGRWLILEAHPKLYPEVP